MKIKIYLSDLHNQLSDPAFEWFYNLASKRYQYFHSSSDNLNDFFITMQNGMIKRQLGTYKDAPQLPRNFSAYKSVKIK